MHTYCTYIQTYIHTYSTYTYIYTYIHTYWDMDSLYDYSNNLYGFYMAMVFSIVSSGGLSIDVCSRNKSNESKLSPYKRFIFALTVLYNSCIIIL